MSQLVSLQATPQSCDHSNYVVFLFHLCRETEHLQQDVRTVPAVQLINQLKNNYALHVFESTEPDGLYPDHVSFINTFSSSLQQLIIIVVPMSTGRCDKNTLWPDKWCMFAWNVYSEG